MSKAKRLVGQGSTRLLRVSLHCLLRRSIKTKRLRSWPSESGSKRRPILSTLSSRTPTLQTTFKPQPRQVVSDQLTNGLSYHQIPSVSGTSWPSLSQLWTILSRDQPPTMLSSQARSVQQSSTEKTSGKVTWFETSRRWTPVGKVDQAWTHPP
jgi:hypothetical protein